MVDALVHCPDFPLQDSHANSPATGVLPAENAQFRISSAVSLEQPILTNQNGDMKDLPVYLNLGLVWRTSLVPEFPMGPTEGFLWNFLAVQLLLNPTSSLPLVTDIVAQSTCKQTTYTYISVS